jgi:protease-4
MSVAEADNRPSVWGFIKGFGKLIIGILMVLQGIVGLALVLLLVGLFSGASNFLAGGSGPAASVPHDAALLINPNGVLVEEAEPVDPFEQAFQQVYGAEEPAQVEVGEVARAIRTAAGDKRIKGIVLDLGALYIPEISASKAHYLAAALDEFKKSGKKVYSVGDFYTQEQYLLASRADEIYLHDKGSLVFVGYAAYDGFVRSFLEKILVTPHVFRVGTFKAAVEPFLRDDMSPEAKEANLAFLGSMWASYKRSVEEARGLQSGAIDRFSNEFNTVLRESKGDLAKAALNAGFVDKLANRIEQKKAMVEAFGESDDDVGFKSVDLSTYLAAIGPEKDGKAPNVAVVTAAGTIVDGEATPGVAAGGDTVAANLKRALDDDEVKAVVLRIDSPGGSAFASEIIRDGVLELKAAGKPVVVSMGSLAASGGYWIAAPGDEIWASPTTVTGSIGIFAFFPTFERAAEYWGINVDGVGTTNLSSIYAAGLGPLEDNIADVFQQSVEAGYRDFLDVVAEGRGLDVGYVDSVGQGRVWIGEQAKGLKLVDNLGDIDDAVAAAAARANLTEFDRVKVREEISPFKFFFGQTAVRALKLAGVDAAQARKTRPVLRRILGAVERKARFFDEFNDPGALYVRCMTCGR